MNVPKTVLLVDDVGEMRTLVRTVVGLRSRLEVVAEASDGREAVKKAAECQPDVVVLDLGLPDLEGREVLTGIRNHSPGSRVVVFSGTRVTNADWVAERVEGFVSKDDDLAILVDLLEAVTRDPLRLATFSLPCHPLSAARARTLTERTLRSWELDELVTDGCIVVSELVTNAVVHAQSDAELRLACQPASLRIAVVDSGLGAPEPMTPSPVRLGGRGLQIVDALTVAWGFDGLRDGGKVVWAELPTARCNTPSSLSH